MAKEWVKSLQCKSSSVDDVYNPKPFPTCKKSFLPLSCSNSFQTLCDVQTQTQQQHQTRTRIQTQQDNTNKKPPKSKPKPKPKTSSSSCPSPSLAPVPAVSLPTLTELPEGHSSRRVVEIIFGSSWSSFTSSTSSARFPGHIEMLFRVHNPPWTVARFEEYRSAVRSAASPDSRCAVDGNEMMRFHCPPGGGHGIYDASVVSSPVCSPGTGKLTGIRTFAGSGGAHESAGCGPRRRSMLVCRVVVGRVQDGKPNGELVSVSGTGKGELIVLDDRAVLPCFLIIYKV